jgi:ribosomal protein S27E
MPSDNVIALADYRATAHLEGWAHCPACEHEWIAVAPVGATQLDCDSCGDMHARWLNPVGPSEGDLVHSCDCGEETLFAVRRDGHFYLRCTACGADQTATVFGD